MPPKSSKRKRKRASIPSDDINNHNENETTHAELERQSASRKPTEVQGPLSGDQSGVYRPDEVVPMSSQASVEIFSIPSDKKPISCNQYSPSPKSKSDNSIKRHSALIFTHGAGGGIANAAIKSFCSGFGCDLPVLAFEGNMNLTSRTRTFKHVYTNCRAGVEGDHVFALGGRSMGARAAVMTALGDDDSDSEEHDRVSQGEIKNLVLVSYPLISPKGESRADILLALPATVSVLFVIGDKDSMCPLSQLEDVRKNMKARSWLCTVHGADHGMSLSGKSKKGEDVMRQMTGRIAAGWFKHKVEGRTESSIGWSSGGDESVVVSGWKDNQEAVREDHTEELQAEAVDDKEDAPRRSSRKRGKKQ